MTDERMERLDLLNRVTGHGTPWPRDRAALLSALAVVEAARKVDGYMLDADLRAALADFDEKMEAI